MGQGIAKRVNRPGGEIGTSGSGVKQRYFIYVQEKVEEAQISQTPSFRRYGARRLKPCREPHAQQKNNFL